MLCRLPTLKYVDIACSQELSFAPVLTILMQTNIEVFNFEPKDAHVNVSDWEIILRTFIFVHFGHNVRVRMPHYGNIWRIAYESEVDENEE